MEIGQSNIANQKWYSSIPGIYHLAKSENISEVEIDIKIYSVCSITQCTRSRRHHIIMRRSSSIPNGCRFHWANLNMGPRRSGCNAKKNVNVIKTQTIFGGEFPKTWRLHRPTATFQLTPFRVQFDKYKHKLNETGQQTHGADKTLLCAVSANNEVERVVSCEFGCYRILCRFRRYSLNHTANSK